MKNDTPWWSKEKSFFWRREWLPTQIFLPGKSYGQRSLAGYSPWGRKELDTTEQLHTHTHTGHMCSALIDTAKQFSKVVVPIRILRAVLESLN